MHSFEIWVDRNQSFERWNLDFIEKLSKTNKNNQWIVIVIDYNIKWFVIKIIFVAFVETFANFIINDLYVDYEVFKKVIINKNSNLWIAVMNKAFEFLKIKHKKIIFYHFRINDAIKKFNDVFEHMFIKYYIEQFIKNWNIYFNQTLFVIRIKTHITIEFSSFYFLYDVNSQLFDDVNDFISDMYDEKIDSISFLNKKRVETFKKTMQRTKKNKKLWNAKIKKKVFKFENMMLIKIKKSKKFEIDWYDFYKIVRSEIFNIYVVKFFEKSFNNYLINDDRMKLTYVNDENVIKNWRFSRDRERSKKIKFNKNAKSEQVREKFVNDVDFEFFYSSDIEKFQNDSNQLI